MRPTIASAVAGGIVNTKSRKISSSTSLTTKNNAAMTNEDIIPCTVCKKKEFCTNAPCNYMKDWLKGKERRKKKRAKSDSG